MIKFSNKVVFDLCDVVYDNGIGAIIIDKSDWDKVEEILFGIARTHTDSEEKWNIDLLDAVYTALNKANIDFETIDIVRNYL